MVLLLALGGFAQSSNSNNARPLAVNQTEGFAQGQLLVFTYFQNFDCIHEPFDDLDHNGQVAAVGAYYQAHLATRLRAMGIEPGRNDETVSSPTVQDQLAEIRTRMLGEPSET